MKQKLNVNWRKLMPVLPAIFLTGCGTVLTASSEIPIIPPLPTEARQPVTPNYCLPSCSSGLIRERKNWLNMLTERE